MRTSLVSSNLREAAWYDNTLYIQFMKGDVYAYADTPARVFLDLSEATSAGKHFAAHIRNAYVANKVTTERAAELGFSVPSFEGQVSA